MAKKIPSQKQIELEYDQLRKIERQVRRMHYSDLCDCPICEACRALIRIRKCQP